MRLCERNRGFTSRLSLFLSLSRSCNSTDVLTRRPRAKARKRTTDRRDGTHMRARACRRTPEFDFNGEKTRDKCRFPFSPLRSSGGGGDRGGGRGVIPPRNSCGAEGEAHAMFAMLYLWHEKAREKETE